MITFSCTWYASLYLVFYHIAPLHYTMYFATWIHYISAIKQVLPRQVCGWEDYKRRWIRRAGLLVH